MHGYNVISKGEYTQAQAAMPVRVSNYVLAEAKGKRYLMLKLVNTRSEKLCGIKLRLTQLDGNKREIDRREIPLEKTTAAASSDFVIGGKLPLLPQCEDFVAEVLFARYGNYRYQLRGGEVCVEYDAPKAHEMTAAQKAALKGRKTAIAVKKAKAPVLIGVFSALLFVALAGASFLHLDYFKNTATEFKYEDIEYRFLDGVNTEYGDIVVTGYKGRAGALRIPATLEAHKVVGMDGGAFQGNKHIRSVVFEGEIAVGSYAFADCKNLQSVDFTNVTSIGNYAFYGSGIREVELGEADAVGEFAFADCDRLQKVTLGEKNARHTTTVASRAFADCASLTEAALNANVRYEGTMRIFEDCANLRELYIEKFNMDSKYSLDSAFGETSALSTLTIGELGYIPEGFARGSAMERFIVGEMTTVIPEEAFFECERLYNVEFPYEITEVGANAFAYTAIENFDFSELQTLGDGAFRHSGLREVNLNTTATYFTMGEEVFSGCSELYSVRLGRRFNQINRGTFENCTSLAEFTYSAVCRPNTIGERAFYGCASLTAAPIPSSVNEIADSAFEGCENLAELHLPSAVRTVGDQAFAYCAKMQTLILSYGLETIGARAFRGCGFASATLPVSVLSVGNGVFQDCDGLTSLHLPYIGFSVNEKGRLSYLFGSERGTAVPASLTEVYITTGSALVEGTFEGCNRLRYVSLPNAMTAIPDSTFDGCTSLEEVSMPDGLSEIGAYAFRGCTSLQEIDLNAGLTYIGEEAFKDCSAMDVLSLPNTLLVIGQSAFAGCAALYSVTVPNSVRNIGWYAFDDCEGLTEITLPFTGDGNGYTRLGYIFDATSVESGNALPENLVKVTLTGSYVPERAFYNCSGLETIVLRDDVTEIGGYAFYGCTSLTELPLPEWISVVGDYAFYGCTALETATLPENLWSVGRGAFGGCNGLTEITLPFTGDGYGTETRFDYIFQTIYGNTEIPSNLTKVTLTGNTVASYAFQNCYGVETVILNENVDSIGDYAFYSCYDLVELQLPEGLSQIGEQAFYNCDSLTELVVPNSVEYIGREAFSECDKLTELTVPFTGTGNGDYGVQVTLGWNSMVEKLTVTGDYLNAYTFNYASSRLKTVALTGAITSISEFAFANASHLQKVELPEGLLQIEEYAFNGCYRLREVNIPSTVESVEPRAFDSCYNLYEVKNLSNQAINAPCLLNEYKEESEKMPTVTTDGYTFSLCTKDNEVGTWYLTGYPDEIVDAQLPTVFFNGEEKITEYALPGYLFYCGGTLSSVEIPSAVVSLGESLFNNCYSLQSVVFGEGSKIKEIPSNAFSNCSKLEEVQLPSSLTTVGDYAFYYCSDIQILQLPKDVSDIRVNAFYGCTRLCLVINDSDLPLEKGSTSYGYVAYYAVVVGPESEWTKIVNVDGVNYLRDGEVWYALYADDDVQEITVSQFTYQGEKASDIRILNGAFRDNYNLISVTLGKGVTEVGENAFDQCNSLQKVDMSESDIKVIESGAFAYCSNMTELLLPKTLIEIREEAFAGAQNLQSLTLPEGLQSIGYNAFYYNQNLKEVVLPSTLEKIDSSAFWECTRLYEIFNLSGLDITVGSEAHGRVAYYALVVYSSLDEERLVATSGNGVFLLQEDGWKLSAYTSWDWRATLPSSFTANGETITSYAIGSNAFYRNTPGEIIVPTAVTAVEEGCFEGVGQIFYEGSEEAWTALTDGVNVGAQNVYFYAECIHSDNEWKYGDWGDISIGGISTYGQVVSEATCQKEGEMANYCAICNELLFTSVIAKAHNYNGDGKCIYCGKTGIVIDENNFKNYFENTTVYPFVYDELGLHSTNKEHDSFSELVFYATENVTVRMKISASSEMHADRFEVWVDNWTAITLSGNEATEWETSLAAGQTLSFRYTKDSSVSSGNDCGIIEKFIIFDQNTPSLGE